MLQVATSYSQVCGGTGAVRAADLCCGSAVLTQHPAGHPQVLQMIGLDGGSCKAQAGGDEDKRGQT